MTDARSRAAPGAGGLPLSVVIPTMGRRHCVADCLADLAGMSGGAGAEGTAGDFEVLVIDQSDDARGLTAPPGLAPERLRVFHSPTPNASLARNIGLHEARGAIVLFLDDDVRLRVPDFLHRHLRHYADAGVPGVYGQVLEVGQAPTDAIDPAEIATDWGWTRLPAHCAVPCRTRNGGAGNLSVRRDLALAVGGMDAWFERGARREETEFNLRLTARFGLLVFDPEAGLTHLSAEGGSRSWGHVRRDMPMHHIVGHWYFLLRVLRDGTLGPRGMALELRHIAVALLRNPGQGHNPWVLVRSIARAGRGLAIAAGRVLRGPRRLDPARLGAYREIGVLPIDAARDAAQAGWVGPQGCAPPDAPARGTPARDTTSPGAGAPA